MWDPALGRYGLLVSDEETVLNTVEHPIALLGFIGSQDYTLLGSSSGAHAEFCQRTLSKRDLLHASGLYGVPAEFWVILAVGRHNPDVLRSIALGIRISNIGVHRRRGGCCCALSPSDSPYRTEC